VPDKSLDMTQYETTTTRLMCDIRTRLISARVPAYPTMARAAKSARKVIDYYNRRRG
jgi:hypothetical protein